MGVINRAVIESYPFSFGNAANVPNPVSLQFALPTGAGVVSVAAQVRFENSDIDGDTSLNVTLESSPDGVTWTNVTNATNLTIVAGGVAEATITSQEYLRIQSGGSGSGEMVLVPVTFPLQIIQL